MYYQQFIIKTIFYLFTERILAEKYATNGKTNVGYETARWRHKYRLNS